jgi:hypothetical protein
MTGKCSAKMIGENDRQNDRRNFVYHFQILPIIFEKLKRLILRGNEHNSSGAK